MNYISIEPQGHLSTHMKTHSIYLAGPISGCSYDTTVGWRDHITTHIDPRIQCFSPMRFKSYLKDEKAIADSYETTAFSSQRGLFARDRYDVEQCDLLFVNLLEAKIASIGTVAEIAWGHILHKPIVLIMEASGNIHDHAFIREMCPFRVDSIDEGIQVTERCLLAD